MLTLFNRINDVLFLNKSTESKYTQTIESDCIQILEVLKELEELYHKGPHYSFKIIVSYDLEPLNRIIDFDCTDQMTVNQILFPQIDGLFTALTNYTGSLITSYIPFLDTFCDFEMVNIMYLQNLQLIYKKSLDQMILRINELNCLPRDLCNLLRQFLAYDLIDYKLTLNQYNKYRCMNTHGRILKAERLKKRRKGVVIKLINYDRQTKNQMLK